MTVLKRNGRWVVDYRDERGRRVQRVAPVQTKRGAEQFEAELRVGGGPSGSSTSRGSSTSGRAPTFRAFAVEWLKTYVLVNNRPSEVVSKESILRVHLIPFFDNRPLDTIGPKDIEAYKAAKRAPAGEGDKPLSEKTVNNHLTVLRKLLVTAEEWELIDRVPTVRRLKVPPAKFDWLTAEEGARFLAALEEHYPQWVALFWAALRTGLRRGELFALAWDDVDLVAGVLTVRHSVYRGKLGPPKNGRERSVPLTAGLVAVLKSHRAQSRLRSAFLFPDAKGKLTIHQDHIDRPLHGALRRAGLRKVTFHSLRHSFASQLVSAGRSLKEVQELLGHTSMQMTMRYAHLAPGRMRDAVAVLDAPVLASSGVQEASMVRSGEISGEPMKEGRLSVVR